MSSLVVVGWKRESISFQAPHHTLSPLKLHSLPAPCYKKSYCSRRYTQESSTYYYPHEKYYGSGPTPELPGWDNNSSEGDHAIPVHLFPKHVAELHLDQVTTFVIYAQFSRSKQGGNWVSYPLKWERPDLHFSLLPLSTKPSFFNWVPSHDTSSQIAHHNRWLKNESRVSRYLR